MNKINPQPSSREKNTGWPYIFGLSAIEGILAAAVLISVPSESSVAFGLSPARLAILAAILLISITCAVFALSRLGRQVGNWMSEKYALMCIVVCLVMAGLSLTGLALLEDLFSGTHTYAYLAYSQRLAPLLTYVAIFLIQIAGMILVLNRTALCRLLSDEKAFLITWAAVFGGFLVLVVLIVISRLGLAPDPIGWGAPTVPLLEWQIWLGIFLLAVSRIFATTRLITRLSEWQLAKPIIAGIIISFMIWLSAVLLWGSQPIPPGFFATPPRAPNFEVYPFSDAAFYDFHAQSMLIGLGFRGDSIPPRPLYIVFLAISHLIAGQNYSAVVLVQTIVLAFFPVTVFWIGKKLSSNSVGIVLALFIILREWTSIVSTPFTSDISNSKLLFADLPAALVISLVVLMTIIWLQNPHRHVHSLLAGGILGISLLIRTQIIILLPVILVFFWIVLFNRKSTIKSYFLHTLVFLFGFTLAVAPWLSRSYGISGQFVFDHPESQTRLMALRYNPSVEVEDFNRQPGESTGEYNQRLNTTIRDQVINNPGYVIQFVMAHWLNSEIANLQIFPIRFSIQNVSELIKPEHAFWEGWVGTSTPRQTAVMLLNLAILTAGGVFLVKRNSWAGILPLVINLAYHFSNAAARNSGWRYLLPVDWIFFIYFTAGIYAIINLGKKLTFEKVIRGSLEKSLPTTVPVFSLATIAIGILCIGFTPLAAEKAFPRLFPPATISEMRQELLGYSVDFSKEDRDGLETLLGNPDVIVLHGRMLYPRFYEEKDGEEKTGKTGYAPMPYARYVFLVAGEPEGTVIFPQTNSNLPLRNAQDVLLVGCMDGLGVKANMVVLPEQGSATFLSEPRTSWACSKAP